MTLFMGDLFKTNTHPRPDLDLRAGTLSLPKARTVGLLRAFLRLDSENFPKSSSAGPCQLVKAGLPARNPASNQIPGKPSNEIIRIYLNAPIRIES